MYIANRIEGTILERLGGTATPQQIEDLQKRLENLPKIAKRYPWAGVCVYPEHVKIQSQTLKGTGIDVVSVVGFPNGDIDTLEKLRDVKTALASGATELDMVIKVNAIKANQDNAVRDDVMRVVEASGGAPVKVIMEACKLSKQELTRGAQLAIEGLYAGAQLIDWKAAPFAKGSPLFYLKRSTGMEDAAIKQQDNDERRFQQLDTMYEVIQANSWRKILILIKDSARIRSLQTAQGSVAHHASRLGVGMPAAENICEEEAKILQATRS